MDIKVVKSFVFNRAILSIVLGACFLIMGLSIYVDHSQLRLVTAAVLEIADNNSKVLIQLANKGVGPDILNTFKTENPEEIVIQPQLLLEPKPDDSFEQEAIEALTKNPDQPFFAIETEPHLVLKYAVNTAWGFLQMTILFSKLERVANRQSFITLCVLFVLQGFGAISLSIFFGYLRLSSERMLEAQKEALESQKNLTHSYERFFPRQFLYLLQKKSVLDIHVGDQIEKKMAVLFSDIRGFTSLIEKKTPAESFQLINDYLKKAAPIIRNNNGFIDKYVGDAILALFDKPDDALNATLNIMNLLKTQKNTQPIREIGSGIHFGSLMVGTLGEEERMDGTVISDIVNTSSRLEALNKVYQTHILVSEQVVSQLKDKSQFKIRFVDHIFVLGKQNSLKIFEIFDMDPQEIIAKKEKIEPLFQKAFACYSQKEFLQALQFLETCQSIYKGDRVIQIFIERTQQLIANPPDASWQPIFRLSHKEMF